MGARVWLLAARPATLPAAIAPVLVGTAAATVIVDFRVGPFVAALIAAIFIQIGTNYANDFSDFRHGADDEGRLGPTRATQAGLVSAKAMAMATSVAFAVAGGLGIYLTIEAGWPVLVVGVGSIVAGYLYTGGPWPYGYHGLGDLFVFTFFGVVAVMGSFFVQAEHLTWEAAAAAIPVGCTVTAILVVNNLRDVPTDRRTGKRTLAVILGPVFARVEYALLLITAFALAPIFAAAELMPWWSMETWLALPLAALLLRLVVGGMEGGGLNKVLKLTGQLHLLMGVLLALSYLW
ncbi:MAG: 1,4-dihydroxy-2-naphthoate octaprenyltransferase [Chloroflexi bacterium]|nr:MAG: 1,4-dihydroxy-2-naphthoate octaprenyltransferase [Chloroflexota bacterium]